MQPDFINETNDKANIFNIQHFSVHDGPGIRTIVFFKGCPLSCRWCSNPESQTIKSQLMVYPDKCVRCGFCSSICSVSSQRNLCLNCGRCTEKCYAEARKMVGKYMTLDEVTAVIEKDIEFYKQSGGGITFSGGEPMLWSDFIKKVGIRCKNLGINTVLETCGYVKWDNFRDIEKVIDLVYYDLKIYDDSKHKQLCGVSNRLIFENLSKISKIINTVVRMPIIPGINDDEKEINAMADYIADSVITVKEIHVLPYHNMGANKYDALGLAYTLEDVNTPDRNRMNRIKQIIESKGLVVKIGG